MSNDNLKISYSMFGRLTDNMVQSDDANWAYQATLLTTHPVVSGDKSSLPAFNGWRYKDVSDPTADKGTHKDGTPVLNFSSMGVRRIQQNLIEMSMFILDFDGMLLLSEVQSIFGEYEYVCYTSFNHQVENVVKKEPAVDKFRVVLPMAYPMPVDKFRELNPAMRYWLDGDGKKITQPESFSIGQIFILPAVREENKSKAVAWRNEGKLLDWTMFEDIKKSMPATAAIRHNPSGTNPSGFVLKPDDILDTANGSIVVRDIDRKISFIRCPFHYDRKPTEFASITTNGTPFLQCKKCGRVYMTRTKVDPIIAGIAKIAEAKRRRAAQEVK